MYIEIGKEWRREGAGRRVGTAKNPGPPVEPWGPDFSFWFSCHGPVDLKRETACRVGKRIEGRGS